jgi:hypothetical protein
MKSPLQALIQMGVIPPVTFPTDSRYYGSSTLTYVTPNFATVARHSVRQGDRLDLITAKYLGDPLIFWLICDANGAIDPHDLVATAGKVLNITTPQGVPGAPNAR